MLVFSDNDDANDRRSVKLLVEALCPELEGRVLALRRPIRLRAEADLRKRRSNAEEIAAQVRSKQATHDVRCVFVHQDAEACEPADQGIAASDEEELRTAGVACAHAVVPATAIEAWWFLFPEAVAAARPSWRRLPKRSRNPGMFSDAKQAFRRAVRRGRFEYAESDSIAIAEKVKALCLARKPISRCGSYERFCSAVDSCCAETS